MRTLAELRRACECLGQELHGPEPDRERLLQIAAAMSDYLPHLQNSAQPAVQRKLSGGSAQTIAEAIDAARGYLEWIANHGTSARPIQLLARLREAQAELAAVFTLLDRTTLESTLPESNG